MTRTYLLKLSERVAVTFLIAFLGTYTNLLFGASASPNAGTIADSLQSLQNLSLFHKAAAAGGLALFQLVLSVFVAPHVGDPASPDLIPKRFLQVVQNAEKFVASPELQALMSQIAKDNKGGVITASQLAAELLKPPSPEPASK